MPLYALATLCLAGFGTASQTVHFNIPKAPPAGTNTLRGSFQGYSMEVASFADMAGNLVYGSSTLMKDKIAYNIEVTQQTFISHAAEPQRNIGLSCSSPSRWHHCEPCNLDARSERSHHPELCYTGRRPTCKRDMGTQVP